MQECVADLFRKGKDLESFRKAVVALNGDFSFDSDSMVRLGKAYLERYPDRVQDRNMEEVRLGYTLVRICIVERLIRSLDRDRRELFRRILSDAAAVPACVDALFALPDGRSPALDYRVVAAELAAIRNDIDRIPKGMVKERFMGGVSSLYNLLYLLRRHLAQHIPDLHAGDGAR